MQKPIPVGLPLVDLSHPLVMPEPNTGCWLWLGALKSNGYGLLNLPKFGGVFRAHRVSYVQANGKIEDGFQLDHVCRNRACVNPDHLEAVTSRENTVRGIAARRALGMKLQGGNKCGARGWKIKNPKKQCRHGHEYTEENTYRDKNGFRACKRCRKLCADLATKEKKYHAARREKYRLMKTAV